MSNELIKPLIDKDVMEFGKHKGEKLANVPAGYLLWFWNQNEKNFALMKYIEQNMEGLKAEEALKDKNKNR